MEVALVVVLVLLQFEVVLNHLLFKSKEVKNFIFGSELEGIIK